MNSLAPNLRLSTPNIFEGVQWYKRSMVIAISVSVCFHVAMLLLKKPESTVDPKHLKAPLAVVLVNSQSQLAPINPKRLAQHNLNGGGQQEEPIMASSVSPMMPGISEKLNTLQEEQNRLLSSLRDDGSQQKKQLKEKLQFKKNRQIHLRQSWPSGWS